LENSQKICGLASTKLRDSARKIEGSLDNYLSQSPPMNHIKTGSAVLDNYLGGGTEMGARLNSLEGLDLARPNYATLFQLLHEYLN
jgi:hypothetical protein